MARPAVKAVTGMVVAIFWNRSSVTESELANVVVARAVAAVVRKTVVVADVATVAEVKF